MKRFNLISSAVATVFMIVIGFSSAASAQSAAYYGMSTEQYKAMQDVYSAFDKKTQPIWQQLNAKQTELDTLYFNRTPPDDPKVQSLMREIDGLNTQLYAAQLEMGRQMASRDIPFYAGHGGWGGHWRGGHWRGGHCWW
jgi:hypothetical protein